MKRATNSALMRIKNEKIILSIINKAPISRADIAKKTGLTKAAVSIIADDLKMRGIIFEQNGKSDTVGRNPVMLYLNSDAFYFIGINITRLSISVGITDLSGKVLSGDSFDICSPGRAFEKINAAVEKQILKLGIDRKKIYKISVVTPGPVDLKNGLILNPPNFNEWHNVPVVSEIKKITGMETVLSNVSSAIAISEKYFGSARGVENFLTLQVDEGIGSGIVIGDTLFKGPCEFGHTSIKYDGEKCECGNRGCLEKYASIPQILKNTKYKSWSEAVDCRDFLILEKEAEYLGAAIISANNIFRFEKIVICGSLAYEPEEIIKLIYKKIEKSVLSAEELELCAGVVKSPYLIAASIAIHDMFA